jgi:hypothetical protein
MLGMNKKLFIAGGVFALVLIVGIGVLMAWPEPPAPVPETPVVPEPVSLTLVGVITEVNFEQVAFDGPSLVTMLVSGTDESRVIAVPSMGLPQCVAAADIADAYQLAPGMDTLYRALKLDITSRQVALKRKLNQVFHLRIRKDQMAMCLKKIRSRVAMRRLNSCIAQSLPTLQNTLPL